MFLQIINYILHNSRVHSHVVCTIKVRELMLGFFKVNISYFKSPKTSNWSNVDLSEEMEAEGQQNILAADDAYTQWSENMMGDDEERSQHANINIIGAVLPSMSDAPIRFQERIISHVYESEGDIWRSLKSFYSAEALRQLYKIVGSLGKILSALLLQKLWYIHLTLASLCFAFVPA